MGGPRGSPRVGSHLASTPGDGNVIISYDTNADSCTTVLPGNGIVAAPVSGTADLAVSVSLNAPSSSTVTVDWTTLFVPGAPPNTFLGPEAPVSDYTASSGTVTFAPGQTTAQVHIPVVADSNPARPTNIWSCPSTTRPTRTWAASGASASASSPPRPEM